MSETCRKTSAGIVLSGMVMKFFGLPRYNFVINGADYIY